MSKIYIVAGHSLTDSGAVSATRQENKETIEFKRLLVEALRQQNPDVEVVTDNDSDSLSVVISKIKSTATANDILLDIHLNSASPTAKGTETFVATNARGKSIRIADRVNKVTSPILGTPNRGVKRETQTRHGRLGILHTSASSVLWEVEFISNETVMEKVDKWKHWLSWEVATILLDELNS